MRVLWLCNVMLPIVGVHLNKPFPNGGGWLTGLSQEILRHDDNDIELAVCFPIAFDSKIIKGTIKWNENKNTLQYFGFPVRNKNGELYDKRTDADLKEIVEEFKPDLIHIFGTEFPHSMGMVHIAPCKETILVGIQGIMRVCAEKYNAKLPPKIVNRYTFRDWIKRDRIIDAKNKYLVRAGYEKETLKNSIHVAGRTKFDFAETLKMNPDRQYHLLNESLRDVFYQNRWALEEVERHTIFISQANYPLKGFHFVLEALPEILVQFPDTKVFVAGDRIVPKRSIKGQIKISSYGKHIKELMKEKNLESCVFFVGSLNAEEMCARYKKSHVFVSASVIENSPNSVGEAMLLGMPVVSSDVGGVSDMITCKEEGILVESADVSAFSKAILAIFKDDQMAIRMGEAANQKAKCTHDKENGYKQLMQIYKTIGKLDEK